MIQKTMLAFVTSLVLFFSLASAASFTISNINHPTSIAENGVLSFSFNVTYIGSSENMNVSFSDSKTNFGTLTVQNATGLNGSESETVLLTGSVSGLSGHGGETLQVTLNGTTSGNSRENATFSVSVTDVNNSQPGSFCEFGEKGDLEIVDFSIDNLGIGDEEEWNLLDEVSIELEIENTNRDDDVDDVVVEIKILDEEGNDVTRDFDLDEEEIEVGRIRDDESEVVTFKINRVPADIEEGTYKLYFKAYSEGDEDQQCVDSTNDFSDDEYQEIEIARIEDPAVVVRGEIFGNSAVCGEQTPITFDVYNLGSDDEDNVLVTLTNTELGIREMVVIENLRSGKMKEVTFNVVIPRNATKNSYDLRVKTYFDYDDGEETDPTSYDEDSDSIDETISIKLNVLNCQAPVPAISAELDSEAVEGEELIVTVSITNKATESKTFVISASGYDEWATVESVSPQNLNLAAGQSGTATITLMPKEAGLNSFVIGVLSDGENFRQPVSVNIEEGKTANLLGGFDSVTIYLLIGIAVLVVLIAIILIIKLARRRKE